MDLPWCERQQTSQRARPDLLVAIVVLSHEGRGAFRSVWRASSRHERVTSAEIKFVLRGRGLENETQISSEAAAYGDVMLLNASAALPRSIGPLVSMLLWFECAAAILPAVPFIGRADDDVWLRLEAIPLHLALVVAEMQTHKSENALVGALQTFAWLDDHSQRDGPFAPGPPNKMQPWPRDVGRSCWHPVRDTLASPDAITGPFNFPKGQTFFLSRSLAVTIARNMAARRDHLVATDGSRCYVGSLNFARNNCSILQGQQVLLPFDDILVGLAISRLSPMAPRGAYGSSLSEAQGHPDSTTGAPAATTREAQGPVLMVHLDGHLSVDVRSGHHDRSTRPASHSPILVPLPQVSPTMISWHSHQKRRFAQEVAAIERWYSHTGGCRAEAPRPRIRCEGRYRATCGGRRTLSCSLSDGGSERCPANLSTPVTLADGWFGYHLANGDSETVALAKGMAEQLKASAISLSRRTAARVGRRDGSGDEVATKEAWPPPPPPPLTPPAPPSPPPAAAAKPSAQNGMPTFAAQFPRSNASACRRGSDRAGEAVAGTALDVLRRIYLLPLRLSTMPACRRAAGWCYLATPKTGSTAVKAALGFPMDWRSYFADRRRADCRRVLLLHRDPIERFLSAAGTIHSRLKSGHPLHSNDDVAAYAKGLLAELRLRRDRCYGATPSWQRVAVTRLHAAPQSLFASLVPAGARVHAATIGSLAAAPNASGLPCVAQFRHMNAREGSTTSLERLAGQQELLPLGLRRELREYFSSDYELLALLE